MVDGKNDIVIKMSGNDERKRIGRNCEHRKLKHFWKCYYCEYIRMCVEEINSEWKQRKN